MKTTLLSVVCILLSGSAFAQTKFDYNGAAGFRYNNSPSLKINALQPTVTFGFTLSPGGKFDLVGVAQTGNYGKKFYSAIDFNYPEKNTLKPHIELKSLYLQKSAKLSESTTGTAQVGILGTEQKLGTKSFVGPTTNFGTNSYAEGARVRLNTKHGVVSVTGGSIYNTAEGDFLQRDRRLNYLEIQASKTVLNNIALELSGGTLDHDGFLRGASEEKVKLFSDYLVTFVQECFWNTDSKAASYSAAASTDLGVIFNQKLKGRLNLDLRYAYNNPKSGQRAKIMNDLYLPGKIGTVALYGKINKAGTFNWFSATDFGDKTRYQTGMTVKFQKKKPAAKPTI